MKRLLRLYRDLWEQFYRIALTAGSTGRDFIRAKLMGVGNKISVNSTGQQSSLSNLHAGKAELPRVKALRTVLRLFGLKSDKQSSLHIYASLVATKAIARLQTIVQTTIVLTLRCISAFRSTLSTASSRLKSNLMGHKLSSAARLGAESSSLNSIVRLVTAFCSRALVGTASVIKSILRSLSSGLTRMADAKSSLFKARIQQLSYFRSRPVLGHAVSISNWMAENVQVFVQLISYVSVSLIGQSATKSNFNGRAIVGNVVSLIAILKQTITTAVSITTNKARNFAGKAENLIFVAAHVLIGTVATLFVSIQSLTRAICRLCDAPVSWSRGLAAWHGFIGQGHVTAGQAQQVISGSRLAQMLSNVAAPTDQPLKITVQAAQHLIPRLGGLQLALTQSFSKMSILLSITSILQGLTTASVSHVKGVGTGTIAQINATIRDATISTRTAFSHTKSASCCILSVLSPADWHYPRQIDTKLYIYQVADAKQNGETLKLT